MVLRYPETVGERAGLASLVIGHGLAVAEPEYPFL